MNVLNDILICHHNPGAMSRYYLTVGRIQGRAAFFRSMDRHGRGFFRRPAFCRRKVLPQESKEFQYKARELYRGKNVKYHLRGGFLSRLRK